MPRHHRLLALGFLAACADDFGPDEALAVARSVDSILSCQTTLKPSCSGGSVSWMNGVLTIDGCQVEHVGRFDASLSATLNCYTHSGQFDGQILVVPPGETACELSLATESEYVACAKTSNTARIAPIDFNCLKFRSLHGTICGLDVAETCTFDGTIFGRGDCESR